MISVPSAGLDVHKISLVSLGSKADAGGCLKHV